ncbi:MULTISPECIES: calcium-binding protein [Actinoplanes]|uniref:calcium-binding protein n=1 Tax=Actinoplanes TaxID=1865 RepID=UPI00069789F4|nr:MULTISPECIES: calcium-binding protein [Actinoplanes]GLY05187.1 hypothetical protein Acsp01_55660 [Actinoplanes sp. NBRC 101535]
MKRINWLPALGAAAAGTLALAAFAAPAQAATTGKAHMPQDGWVNYIAAWGQKNNVVVTRSGNTIIIDDVVKIRAGKGCVAVKGDKTKVKCKSKGEPTKIRVHLRDKNDKLVNKTDVGSRIDAGNGNDHITLGGGDDAVWAGHGSDTVYAGGGNDTIYGDGFNAGENRGGKPGNDVLNGGAGDDQIHGDGGNDKIRGNAGRDSLDGGEGKDDCAPSKADTAALCEA